MGKTFRFPFALLFLIAIPLSSSTYAIKEATPTNTDLSQIFNPYCGDTDGKDYFTQGFLIYGIEGSLNSEKDFYDVCVGDDGFFTLKSSALYEGFCRKNFPAFAFFDCPSGHCYNGHCLDETTAVCTDSDAIAPEGFDYYMRGETGNGIVDAKDSCLNASTLKEYKCNGNVVEEELHTCAANEICMDGTCVVTGRSPNCQCDTHNSAVEIYQKGSCTMNNITLEDFCEGENMQEARCLGQTDMHLRYTEYTCPCEDGRCLYNNESHAECVNMQCRRVPGPGANECSTLNNADCLNDQTPPITSILVTNTTSNSSLVKITAGDMESYVASIKIEYQYSSYLGHPRLFAELPCDLKNKCQKEVLLSPMQGPNNYTFYIKALNADKFGSSQTVHLNFS